MKVSARIVARRALAVGGAALFAHAPLASSQAAINCASELYGMSQNGALFRVNINTGAGSLLGSAPVTITEIEFDDATGQLWSTDGGSGFTLRRLDPATGAQLSAVALNPPGMVTGMEFIGNTLYGTYSTGVGSPSMLVTIDRASGAVTTIGATGVSVPISGLAYDASTATMYGVTAGGHAISSLLRINPTTGASTFIGQIGTFDKIGSIEFGPDGNLYGGIAQDGISNPGWLLRINPATAVPTLVGNTNFSITGLAACLAAAPPPPPPPPPPSPATPVPTLSTLALATLAFVVAITGFAARRRRGD